MSLFCQKTPLPLEIWRLFSAQDNVSFVARDAGYPSLFPRGLLDASPLEVFFGQVFVCPSYWILSLGVDSFVLFPSFAQILFFQLPVRQPAAPDGKTKQQLCSWPCLLAGRL